mgnify:FL=1
MYEFHWPTKTFVGPGIVKELDQHVLPENEDDRLLIIAPREPWAGALVDKIAQLMLNAGWKKAASFPAVEPNPSWNTVEKGIQTALENKTTTVIAFGGGSAMDAGKVIADRSGAARLITLPTTAGTGGEISPWAVISNPDTREKDSVVSKWPDMTFLDPELTLSVPPLVTLFTGIDAFIHGLEAYLSSNANPLTDALAIQGMTMIVDHLEIAVENGQDLEARSALMQASLLTGASMLHAGLGLMHAIGNVTGGLYHQVPHGLILMRCMDSVLAFNQPAAGDKYQAIQDLVKKLREITSRLFIRLSVPEVRIAEADLEQLAKRAVENVNATTNPRPANTEQVNQLVRDSFLVE